MLPLEAALALDLRERDLALLSRLLADHVPGAEVWAYGSRVNGGAHEGSDLDLVVREASDAERPVTGTEALREALRESPIPIRVDVLDWTNLPPSFRAEVERRHLRIAPV